MLKSNNWKVTIKGDKDTVIKELMFLFQGFKDVGVSMHECRAALDVAYLDRNQLSEKIMELTTSILSKLAKESEKDGE